MKITKRTNARILAVQILYGNIFSGSEYNVADTISAQSEEEFTPKKYDEDLLEILLENSGDNIEHFDQIIAQHLEQDWPMDRLDKVLLTIMRVALCELIYSPSSATNVIIDEYTTITSCFLVGAEVNFINAILQKMSPKVRDDK